jgi:hypothetical protein
MSMSIHHRSPATSSSSPSSDPNQSSRQLVPPDGAALAPIFDVATILFAVQIEQQHSQESAHEAAILANAAQAKQALEQVRIAAEQARAAASETSFWNDIVSALKTVGAVSTVAAGVASGIASGGVSTVGAIALAGVLLSTCSKPLAKLCGGNDTFQRDLELGLGLGGAALTLGAGGVGLFAGAGATASASEGVKVAANVVRVGGTAVAGAAAIGQGYATIRAGASRADQTGYEADGVEARAHQRQMRRTLDDLVQSLKTLTRSFEGAKAALADAQKQIGAGNYAMLATLGR